MDNGWAAGMMPVKTLLIAAALLAAGWQWARWYKRNLEIMAREEAQELSIRYFMRAQRAAMEAMQEVPVSAESVDRMRRAFRKVQDEIYPGCR